MAAFRVFLIALGLTAPVWALSANSAYACSCGADLESLVNRSAIIVIGTPVDTAIIDSSVGTGYQALTETSVDVQTYVKGSGPGVLLLRSVAMTDQDKGGLTVVVPGLGPTCGYAPDLNIRHLFFATEEVNGVYPTGGCQGNIAFLPGSTFADERLEAVRQLLEESTIVDLPDTGTGSGNTDGFLGWQVTAAAGVLLAASASAVLVAVVRRRRPS